MGKVSRKVELENAKILMGVLHKYGDEFIQCTQIAYYVDDELLFKSSGEIMVNRRDNYPKLQILSPSTEDYTESFQENSCVFTNLSDFDVIQIETSYTPYKTNRQISVKFVITF